MILSSRPTAGHLGFLVLLAGQGPNDFKRHFKPQRIVESPLRDKGRNEKASGVCPMKYRAQCHATLRPASLNLVDLRGIEPLTSALRKAQK